MFLLQKKHGLYIMENLLNLKGRRQRWLHEFLKVDLGQPMPDPSIAPQASMEEAARKAISRLTEANEIQITFLKERFFQFHVAISKSEDNDKEISACSKECLNGEMTLQSSYGYLK